MALKKWDSLPERMRTPEVKPYYDSLSRRRAGLALKRIFDLVMSVLLIIILSPLRSRSIRPAACFTASAE